MNDPLKSLPREVDPPPHVRRDLVVRMRREGLMRGPGGWRRFAAAAALLIGGFLLGWMAGRVAGPSHPELPDTPQFMLLLYGTPSDPARDAVSEYGKWARGLASKGHSVHGEKLGDAAAAVGGAAPASIPSGFFTIGAASLDEARTIAAGHPHVRRGGIIVVRPVDPTP